MDKDIYLKAFDIQQRIRDTEFLVEDLKKALEIQGSEFYQRAISSLRMIPGNEFEVELRELVKKHLSSIDNELNVLYQQFEDL